MSKVATKKSDKNKEILQKVLSILEKLFLKLVPEFNEMVSLRYKLKKKCIEVGKYIVKNGLPVNNDNNIISNLIDEAKNIKEEIGNCNERIHNIIFGENNIGLAKNIVFDDDINKESKIDDIDKQISNIHMYINKIAHRLPNGMKKL